MISVDHFIRYYPLYIISFGISYLLQWISRRAYDPHNFCCCCNISKKHFKGEVGGVSPKCSTLLFCNYKMHKTWLLACHCNLCFRLFKLRRKSRETCLSFFWLRILLHVAVNFRNGFVKRQKLIFEFVKRQNGFVKRQNVFRWQVKLSGWIMFQTLLRSGTLSEGAHYRGSICVEAVALWHVVCVVTLATYSTMLRGMWQ